MDNQTINQPNQSNINQQNNTNQIPQNQTPLSSSFNNNSPNSFNKTYLFIALGVFLILIITFLFLYLGKKNNQKNIGLLTEKKGLFIEDLSKYDKDSDADGYPDFIEDAIGLDKNVSEQIRCQQNSCDVNLQTNNQKKNVLIILDASGSMDLLINGKKRIDLAKEAIKNYVNQSSNINNIGIMIYGHKGSNNVADKAVSCATAETIAEIGTVNTQNIDIILSPVKSTGWTLMGKAINESIKAFAGKEGQKNEIIMVTDGEETCGGDPVSEARNAKNSSYNITVNVIAFAVEPTATTSLIQIANAGGGSFVTASNGEELDRKFNELYEKGLKALEFTKCKGVELETINKCYKETYNKVDQYIQNEKKKYFNKLISAKEYQRLDDLSSKIFKQLMDFSNKTLEKYKQSTKEVHDKAFGQ